jgi:L-ribulose-5-phosphate 3-epimerase
MKLGVLVILSEDVRNEFKKLREMEFSCCQLSCWDMNLYNDEIASKVRDAAKEFDIEITALWAGWTGNGIWDFQYGPSTLGLVPVTYRYTRIQELKMGSDFAKKIGVTDVITHVGFLPENPNTTEFTDVVCAIREVAEYCKNNGQYFLFETGQETPVTLRRTIEQVGTGNLGINLDPANLIMYGKANPVDALDVFGEYVRNIHGKDGRYPTDGMHLGIETPIGEGKVNYPDFISKLKEIGYNGPITIEREISGEEQIADIKKAKILLESLI